MANEEKIVSELKKKFSLSDDAIRIARERRIYMAVQYASLRETLEYVSKKMDFTILCTITGQDEGDVLTCIYHTARLDGTMLNIKTAVPKSAPKIKTVSDVYPCSIIYERELHDLLGFEVEGLPEGKRYPLPDDWPDGQYPLRKDWKPEMLEKK